MISKKLILGCCALALLARPPSSAQASPASTDLGRPVRYLVISPCSATVSVAKLTLAETALEEHRGNKFVGRYQISVTPFFFLSRKGTLSVTLSAEALREIESGSPANFTGIATSESGKSKPFHGRATPTGADRGTLQLEFMAKDNPVVFRTGYRLANHAAGPPP